MAGLLQDRLVHLTTGLTIHLDDLDLSSRQDESYHLQQKKLLVRPNRPVCNILSHTDNSYHLQKKRSASEPTVLFAKRHWPDHSDGLCCLKIIFQFDHV